MDLALDSSGGPPGPIGGPSVWTATDLPSRPEWAHRLDDAEREELRAVAARAKGEGPSVTVDGRPLEETTVSDVPLARLSGRLATIRDQLEAGAGAVRMHGFPIADLTASQARAAYWALAVHLGTPVSQSARGERIYSVLDAGFANDDPRSRGPNTSRKLSFHTDRADVVGFLCLAQARDGGENEIASAPAVYNEILRRRPDLLAELVEPFYYLRHTIDTGNERPWCRLPVFSFRDGFFACCLLRVLIERAHGHPDLPDLTDAQVDALDLVEAIAASDAFRVVFRQEAGDLIWINNWTVLHKRRAFVDHDDAARRRHILRVWLSMPNSRPLDPCFVDHFGAVEAGALRGGIHP